MSFREISQIAGSAMTAQSLRLNTVASNLANAQTAAGAEDQTYHARKPVFATVYRGGYDEQLAGASVQVLDVVESTEPLRQVYEPENPQANEDGMVFYPNVNPVAEMTDMLEASRAFETNVEVMSRVKNMQQSLLRLGES
ncbi:MAG: flagellar basal body rod protein FlgC [Candidatus Dactylopiibacterium carminicum]|uniref:Flagellar basal-body rod protein FlgC n=1 Tax=Candidatus Dactylopiibacterium carminicum TaxID=857335 RepID=A0A272EWH3_9RHOO|nr:flagellar basal body rod protein FlgC [Candidatus Dactylopiibacterium carminicum]KAF7599956.1 flagellar basal body rod protein FlgC [Candidatus Dactylopiibacterium carminicum]PAS94462.1 MAG: flagellar basal body rod protein FlgC [Candidatus Dactylopiibacterium carminicum]PAS97052.1 MAG: flagellar basal body rod protein FlgC [Candidatus Dactylopiibacterium carminicum]PAS99959.1 MAG: flagellar basal body rod protein FlgC [Candidatus Dactylopiibacterium carminicum]